MSSLAKQLKQLQIPGILSTSQQAKASKRASLLFDAKEAAGIDTETVYSLGLNGLEGLKVIDQAFSAFENSLFGESWKSLERTVQSKEVNEKLDKHISKFLQYLSPYILLKPAHKALEWLIRRFQIHVFNVDDLVSCILPYHETNLFARVLQLVSIGSPSSKWHWLYPVQKAGVPLSKTALLQHCISDSSFLSRICDMVKRMLESDIPSSSFRVLFAFYTSTVVGSLELMGSVSERFLTLLLPYILDGLKSGVSELVASSYMIIAQLCSMCSMNEGLVKSLVDCICKHIDSGLAAEGLSCLTFICQSQGIKKLSKRSFKALVKLAWLVKIGSQLSSTHDINPLLQVFLPQLISTGLKDCLTQDQSVPVTTESLLEIALNLLKEIELESDLAVLVGRTLISGYCSARDKLGDNDTELQDLHEKIRGLIQLLEKRYPVELEKAIGGHLGSLKAAEETDDEDASPIESQSSLWTMDLVSLALTGVKSQVIVDSNTTLVISLHHPQAEVRQMAVKRLGQLLNTKESLSEDAHFVGESLLNRLQDEDPAVVASVLNLGQVLVKSVPGSQLVEQLFKLLNNKSSKWDEVRNKSTVLLLGEWVSSTVPSLTDQVVFGLLPLFFLHHPVCETAIPQSVTASKSAVASCHPLLSGMKDFVKTKEWKSCDESSLPESLAAANSLLINWLGKNLMKMEEKQGIQLVHSMIQHAKELSDDSLFHPLLQCLLGRVIALTTGQYKLTLCEVFAGLVLPDVWKITRLQGTYESIEGADSESEPASFIPASLLTGLVRLLGKRSTKRVAHARAAITLWLCKNLLRNMPAVKTASSGVWWSSGETDSPENIYSKLLVSLLEVSAFGSSTSMSHQVTFKQLLQDLIEFHLPDKLALLKFLAHLWSTHLHRGSDTDTNTPGISALLKVQCLHIASACLGSLPDKTIKQLSKSTCAVIPSLLVPLCSPISAVRRSAISCVKSFGACLTSVPTCPVTSLISVLTNNAQELTADPQHLQRVFTEYFAPLMSSVKPKSKHAAEVKAVGNTLNFILQHITSDVTPTHVKRILLSSLSGVVTQDMLRILLPLLLHLLDQCSEEGGSVLSQDDSILLQLVVKKLTPATAPLLQPDSQPWKVMLRVLSMRTAVCPGHPAPIIVLLEQISNRFFQAIPTEGLQRRLVKLLLDALLETKDVVIGNSIKTTIMTLSLTADLITEELYQFNVREENEPKKKKLKKTHPAGDGGHDDAYVTRQLQRSTVILELLQHKINVVEQHKLVPTLFAVLRRCMELDHSQSSSEYIMQLIFSVINNICHKLSPDGSPVAADFLPEDQFDVELLVQCIRSSESPQTHNQALLLLAKAAQLFPEKVLHNVMSIFTFMGASVLRQDDTYSFQVITKTLDTVIPALIQAGEKQQLPAQMSKKNPVSLADIVGMLIRVFVDASPHVPEHRQLPLFTHLVSTVGSTQFLHITLILLLEKHVVHGSTATEEKEPAAHSPLGVDFCLSLFHSFDPDVQVEAILQLLQYIDHLPFEKPEGRHKPRVSRKTPSSFLVVTPLFDVDTHSAKHLRQFKYASVGLVPTLLSSEGFVNKVHDQGKKLNSLFMRLLEETLNFVTRTAQHAEDMAQDTTGKFWRALLHKAYDIIDKINLLLAPSVFFGVIQKLLQSSNVTVRRKAMELLNSKLSQSAGNFPDDQVDALLSLVTELLVITKGTGASEESVVNRQTALYSLKLLSRLLAKKHPDPFKEVISAAMKVFSSKDANVQVASSALLCVAEVVGGLQAHAIPFLPKLMPSVLKLLRRTGKDGSGLLTLCGITALLKTTEALPHFLSPYLVDMLVQVTSPSLNGVEVTEGHEEEGEATKQSSVRAQLKDRLESLRKELACKISPRVLISAVSQCYDQVLDTEKESVSVLMSLLAESVNSMSKEDIKSYQSQLFNLFLVALDFRAHHTHENDGDLVDKTEGSVIEAFLCLIVKLSEASFRPMFLRVMDWATRTSSNKERLLVFYRLCDNVAGKLKGLFVLFAGYIVKNCASLLNATNTAKTEETLFEDVSQEKGTQNSCELLSHLLDCLYKCLMYDTHGFLDNDRFQCLMQPLVDQIENPLGGEEKFKERLSHHLVPCLAQFAVACGNDAQWKPLNYQVLLKTRHSSAPVRFAALKVLEGFHSRLGEDFMVLLPETIPFLAELMEDECFEVEQQCQHVISEIEEVLGESLQKYF